MRTASAWARARWGWAPPWRSAWCRCWVSCSWRSPSSCARTEMVGELTWQKRLIGLWLPLAGFLVVALFPFTWMAATSLKTNAELYDPTAMPLAIRHPSLVHYIDLLRETNFLTWIANTMLVAVIATGISLLLGSMLAYPLARMRFRGAPLLAVTVAVTYLVPQTLLFVPMADPIGRMRLGNTLSAVMLTYPTLLVPFLAWLLVGYFKPGPKELEEQALIDGASRWRAMSGELLTLWMPGFISVG